jgi:hypothetical protein
MTNSMDSAATRRAELPSFSECVLECFRNPELMAEYRRLAGSSLGLDERSGIARLIDEAAQFDPWESEYAPFFEFVRDCVWLPLLGPELARRASGATEVSSAGAGS